MAKMTQAELLEHIDLIRGRISADDSMEGNLQYEWSDEPGIYEVSGVYRIGNSDGQGGVRFIGGVPLRPENAFEKKE